MSILRNITIGALGEGINRMEQKDRMYAEIAVNAGKNYFTNVLPQSIKAENFRKSTYDKIFSITGDRNFTELMDRDGFTTQTNGVELAKELYKKTYYKGIYRVSPKMIFYPCTFISSCSKWSSILSFSSFSS